MAKKKDASPVRLAVDNAEPVAPPPAEEHDGGSSRRSGREPPPPLPPGCPIIPLGMDGNVRFYLDAQRQLIALPVGRHNRLELMGLYGDDAHLMRNDFPRHGNDNKVNGIDAAAAQEALLSHTALRLWSPTAKARGRGCWAGEDGSLVVNTGTAILANERWQPPGLFGEYAMVAREGIMKPALAPERGGSSGPAQEILALLETWNWERRIDARLLLGWIVCAFYGAALPIRPVGWLLGPRSTGKSTLQTALDDLLGGWILSVLDPTPAGIYQSLGYDCLAVGVDEAENEDNQESQRRLQELVRLARLCFSGGKMPRGGSGGTPMEFALRSAVLFSSINPPSLTPQDRSRMIIMRLAKLLKTARKPDLSRQRLRTLGARLLRRAIDAWPRLAAAFEQYEIALKDVGHEGRSVQVFGYALAAADIVLNDHPVDSDSGSELAAQLDIAILPEAQDDLPEERVWLQRLLGLVIPLDGTGPRNTIAALIRQAVTGAQSPELELSPGGLDVVRADADRVLSFYGLKVLRPKGGKPAEYVAIANRNSGLERLHANTRWAARPGEIGGWKNAAERLEGAIKNHTCRFASGPDKGTCIPLRLVLPAGADDDAPVAPVREPMKAEP